MFGRGTLARYGSVSLDLEQVTVLAALQEVTRGTNLGLQITP